MTLPVIALSPEQLTDILENKTRHISFDASAEAHTQLSDGNRLALVCLTKAAIVLNDVFLKQDHPDNVDVRAAFAAAADRGDEHAAQALALFDIHNGIEGRDMYADTPQKLRLVEGMELQPGRGHYPKDLTKEELKAYVLSHPEQAAAIFSNNTVVRRDGDELEAVPYSVAYRDEMRAASAHIMEASRHTDHDGLKKYLQWQAQALVNDSDPEAMYKADVHWLALEDSPLEFTIERESYADRMTAIVAADPDVKAVLDLFGIKAKSKDTIGVRVGIVNPESMTQISAYRDELSAFDTDCMPQRDQYSQSESEGDRKRVTFADVDIVAMTGRYAAIRGVVTLAQNLPNNDKLAVILGKGNRLVFHRSVRQSADPDMHQKLMDGLVAPQQHGLYDLDAKFHLTIGHELGHALGPKVTTSGAQIKTALGAWGDVLEENKADVVSLMMVDHMARAGRYSDLDLASKVYLTWAVGDLPTKKPHEDQPHQFRSIMQHNYFREHGAISFEPGGKLSITPEKIPVVARQMASEIIDIQLSGDTQRAEAFVKKYSAWNDGLQHAVDTKKGFKPKLYRHIHQPYRDTVAVQMPGKSGRPLKLA